jgi:ABC-type amino acid transport system permease subunit
MRTAFIILAFTLLLQGCAVQVASSVAGAAVGTVAGTAIGVAKVPFQVGGAVVDVVSGG